MKLNIEKINQEMARLGINQNQLAQQMGISRQLLDYYLHTQSKGLRAMERLAAHFKIDPRDLLISQ